MNVSGMVGDILTIHRDPAGWIGFARHRKQKGEGFRHLFAIKAEELDNMLPTVADWLIEDSYFTPNSMFSPAPWNNRLTGLPDVARKETRPGKRSSDLYRLLTCYVDIDCGRADASPGAPAAMHWREAAAVVGMLADAGHIPQPSIFAESGRGMYLFWLLHDPTSPDGFQNSFRDKIELYKYVNKRLGRVLAESRLPVDKGAFDSGRFLRCPRSIHSKANRPVAYMPQVAKDGGGYVYTLKELAGFLAIDIHAELPSYARNLIGPARPTKEKGAAPNRKKGQRILCAKRADDLLTISRRRGGIAKRGEVQSDGTTSPGRAKVLTLYARCLYGAGVDRADILAAVGELAATMRPAYPSDPPADDPPLASLVDNAATDWQLHKNKTLCSLLSVDADRAKDWELMTIIPPALAAERKANRLTVADRQADRAETLYQYVTESGRMPTQQAAAKILATYGYEGSKSTARRALLEVADRLRAEGVAVIPAPGPGRKKGRGK